MVKPIIPVPLRKPIGIQTLVQDKIKKWLKNKKDEKTL